MSKTLKPDKPLRESLLSHHRSTPEEEVRTIAQHIQEFVEGREVIFFSILVAILLALGGGGILWFLRSSESDIAREKLGQTYAAWREVYFPTGAPGAPPPAPEVQIEKARSIEGVAKEFPDTRPGALASYLAGNAYAQAGRAEEAVPLLEAALVRFEAKDPARPFAQSALASALEDQGQTQAALKAWTALMAYPSPEWKLAGLLGRRRILERAGKNDEARAILATVIAEFPEETRALGFPVTPAPAPGSELKVTTRPIKVEGK